MSNEVNVQSGENVGQLKEDIKFKMYDKYIYNINE